MKVEHGITKERLRELFTYKSGCLIWAVNKGTRAKIGNVAGGINKDSRYWEIRVDGKTHRAHRLIWLYHFGSVPIWLDHINRNKIDNRVENLRPTTVSENSRNRGSNKKASSKYKVVYKATDRKKWRTQIWVDNRSVFLGYFDSEILAAQTYNLASRMYYGETSFLNGFNN